ncbi:MAG: 4Fe-4S binding protein [Thermoplasmata archaeon]
MNAVFLKEFIIEINQNCTACGLCVKACPVGAILLEEYI